MVEEDVGEWEVGGGLCIALDGLMRWQAAACS